MAYAFDGSPFKKDKKTTVNIDITKSNLGLPSTNKTPAPTSSVNTPKKSVGGGSNSKPNYGVNLGVDYGANLEMPKTKPKANPAVNAVLNVAKPNNQPKYTANPDGSITTPNPTYSALNEIAWLKSEWEKASKSGDKTGMDWTANEAKKHYQQLGDSDESKIMQGLNAEQASIYKNQLKTVNNAMNQATTKEKPNESDQYMKMVQDMFKNITKQQSRDREQISDMLNSPLETMSQEEAMQLSAMRMNPQYDQAKANALKTTDYSALSRGFYGQLPAKVLRDSTALQAEQARATGINEYAQGLQNQSYDKANQERQFAVNALFNVMNSRNPDLTQLMNVYNLVQGKEDKKNANEIAQYQNETTRMAKIQELANEYDKVVKDMKFKYDELAYKYFDTNEGNKIKEAELKLKAIMEDNDYNIEAAKLALDEMYKKGQLTLQEKKLGADWYNATTSRMNANTSAKNADTSRMNYELNKDKKDLKGYEDYKGMVEKMKLSGEWEDTDIANLIFNGDLTADQKAKLLNLVGVPENILD